MKCWQLWPSRPLGTCEFPLFLFPLEISSSRSLSSISWKFEARARRFIRFGWSGCFSLAPALALAPPFCTPLNPPSPQPAADPPPKHQLGHVGVINSLYIFIPRSIPSDPPSPPKHHHPIVTSTVFTRPMNEASRGMKLQSIRAQSVSIRPLFSLAPANPSPRHLTTPEFFFLKKHFFLFVLCFCFLNLFILFSHVNLTSEGKQSRLVC